MAFLSHSSPLEKVRSSLFPQIQLWIKRDDLLHPTVSGNKFRKLKYNLAQAGEHRPTLISMGGAWSNHLHALAHAAQLHGLSSIGLVRGLHAAHLPLSATLADCQHTGMQLHFVSRDDYRDLRDHSSAWQRWTDGHPDRYLWLPEGGSNAQAIRGVAELVQELINDLDTVPDTIILACGTGATLAGVVAGLNGSARVIGIAAVSNAAYLHSEVQQLLRDAGFPTHDNFEILHDFTQGGFAKTTPALMQFCRDFFTETQILLEPVYTGKMFFALAELCRQGKFVPGERVVAIHTGGLQGLRGYPT